MSRRLEKVTHFLQQEVSDVIRNKVSDPRIQGLITVTRVEVAADLRSAKVFLSILGTDDTRQKLTLRAIEHAGGYIQSCLADRLSMRTCPTLSFFLDDSLKKGFQIVRILDQLAAEDQEKQRLAAENQEKQQHPIMELHNEEQCGM